MIRLCWGLCVIFAVAFPLIALSAEPAEEPGSPPVDVTLLPDETREAVRTLIVQDYLGRMKPVDTLARALVRKITKRFDVDGQDPLDTYLSWLANPDYWWDQPLIYVRHPGLKQLLAVQPHTTHVRASRFLDDQGQYLLRSQVDDALRTPDRERTKTQRKLIAFDERMNLLHLAIRGKSLRVFPIPGDANNSWLDWDEILVRLPSDLKLRYWKIGNDFQAGLKSGQAERFAAGVEQIGYLQREFGSEVLPGPAALGAELLLNRIKPFSRLVWSYLVAAVLLMGAFFINLVLPRSRRWFQIPYWAGSVVLWLSVSAHLAAFVMRWVASGRAPLSNGYESLLFIGFSVAIAGLLFEVQDRRGAAGGTGALLTFLVLGISMMSHFDPAIGLLVPILHSYWLNIHVTVITASYGFLGLGSLVGALILVLYLGKRPERDRLRSAIHGMANILFNLNLTGLGLLTIGTLLGGIWANESWGRYWGWDPKESWSLVTILFYTVVSHTRLIPALKRPWVLAAGSLAGISTVIMTFFGVNYYLVGLHSYAQGGVSQVPGWVYVLAGTMLGLILISGGVAHRRRWSESIGSTGIFLVMVFVASTAIGQETGGCVTAECHSGMESAEWVHGPVGAGACSVCHVPVQGTEHSFDFTVDGEELCFACHEDSRDLMLSEYVHTPIAQGFCTQCHDPHQSPHRFLLKWAPESTCFACHQQDSFQNDHIHGPVAVGECTACHDPHASDHEPQLLEDKGELCFRCHMEKVDIRSQRHIHAPAQSDCTVCHEVHASQASFLLKDPSPVLCFDCHTQLAQAVSVDHPHPPVADGQCGECHDPHASPYPKLFTAPATELCYPCHEELQEYISAQKYQHGPVAQGDCSACHDPHGSDNHVMLHKYFPEEFYKPYAEETYEMCFECHNPQMAVLAHTKTLTGFRDGKVNMHYLHVNKEPKGRSCRACHQVHASSQEKHIRLSVPFGDIAWELPVTFTANEEGGSCQVGCHAPKGYSRK